MSVEALLTQLAAQGVELWVEGSRLRFRAQSGALSPAQRTEIGAKRSEVMAELRSRACEQVRYAPLSFSQRALWFVHQEDPTSAAYNVGTAAEIHGEVDAAVVQRALQALVDRHAILRTTYEVVEGQPRQRVAGGGFAAFEVRGVPGLDAAALKREVESEYRKPFDLERGPVMRSTLFTRDPRFHVLLINFHHIATDGWSLLVLLEELNKLLIDEAGGAPAALPRPDVEYTDYTAWQLQMLEGAEGQRLASYWTGKLAEPRAEIDLPSDRPRPARRAVRGATLEFRLDPRLSERITQLAKAEGSTLFVVMLAAFKALLYRYTGTEDVVVGTPAFGRTNTRFARVLGDFVNPVPLRSQLSAQMSFRELLTTVKRTLGEALDAQEYPLPLIVEKQGRVRDPSRSALFETVFVLQRFEQLRDLSQLLVPTPAAPLLDFGGLKLRPFAIDQQEGQFDLGLAMIEAGDSLSAAFKYNRAIFDAETIRQLSVHFQCLLGAIVANPAMALGELPLLDAAERRSLLEGAGRVVPAVAPDARTLHGRFEEQVRRTPDALALTYEDQTIRYAELNRRANRLAHCLIAQGVKAETMVALYAERSLDLVVGVLGILKAGGAYVPIDLSYPADRVGFMLEDTRAPVLVTQSALRGKLPQFAGTAICIDTDLESQPDSNPGVQGDANDLAYVIYTSGSTGRPKGTMLTHRAVDRLFTATDEWFGFNDRDVWTMFHSVAFDFSVWELWGALLYGGRLVVVPYLVSRTPEAFLKLLRDEGVTVLNQTPSAFRQLVQADLACVPVQPTKLRTVIFGGEALELQSLRPWFARHGDRIPQLVNMYGITETCVHVTYRPIRLRDLDAGAGSVIGVPIPDLRVHVLDARREPAPPGVVGEMYVGGPGLARGYLNRAELTEERFIPDPFVPGERLYRSGDLAKRLRNGEIEYLGRIDHQVKIRGFRIELGEIEAVIAQCAHVRQSVVLALADASGAKRLVAYIVAAATPDSVLPAIRTRVAADLPDYMMPSAFVFLESLPLTSNGKVDRAALPAPDMSSTAQVGEYTPPETDTERTLGAIWCELLGLPRVGRHDNFFQLGGHSLLVVTLLDRMRRAGLPADVRSVFSSPTLAEMAAAGVPAVAATDGQAPLASVADLAQLDASTRDLIVADVPGGAQNVQDIYPLIPCQEGMLFHHVLHGESGADTYQVRSVLEFASRGLLDRFVLALRALVERHDALRTAVIWEDVPQPLQVVYRKVELPLHEVSPAATAQGPAALLAASDASAVKLDLRRAPLIAAYAAPGTVDGKWQLALVMHHIAVDHYSVGVLLDEIRALLSDTDRALAPPPPMRDVVAAALAVPAATHETYFRETLAGIGEPTYPFGLSDVRVDSHDIQESRKKLAAPLAAQIRDAAGRSGVSPAVLFHIAWALVVANASRKDDVVFGTVLSGRAGGHAGLDRVIGMFINTLPCRVSFARGGLGALVKETFRQLAELSLHDQASLAQAQRCSGLAAGAPLFSALINFRHAHGGVAAGTRGVKIAEGVQLVQADDRTNYPLTLSVDDLADAFEINIQCVSRVNAALVLASVEQALEGLVTGLAAPDASAASVLEKLSRASASADEDARRLLESLQAKDVRLTLEAGRLKVNAPKGALDEALKAAIGSQRDALIRVLQPAQPADRAVSQTQQRLWFLRQVDPTTAAFNLPAVTRIHGPLDTAALERAVARVVARHASLRTRFVATDGTPRSVLETAAQAEVDVTDLTSLPATSREYEAADIVAKSVLRPFDLNRCPLLRASVARLAPDEHLLCVVLDHMVGDDMSVDILLAELGAFYAQEAQGTPVTLAPLREIETPLSADVLARDRDYWMQRLAGLAPMLHLPTDRPRPPVQTYNGARVVKELPPGVCARIEQLARSEGVTTAVVLMAAFQTLLHRYTGETDIAVGTIEANRSPQQAGLIGFFANNVVIRSDFDGAPSVATVLARVREAVEGAHAHRQLPFDRLVEALAPRRELDHPPLYQTQFSLRPVSLSALAWPGLQLERVEPLKIASRLDLTVEAVPSGEALALVATYNCDLFDAATIERMLGHLRTLIEGFVADAARRVADIPMLAADEAERMIVEWNRTEAPFDIERTVHSLFESRVARNPGAVAVRFEDEKLTYAELDARANQLARHLRALGCGPDKLVGVWMERSATMVVALLGILKAGGAYVPLDPAFPRDRIEFMIEDGALEVVLTQAALADALPGRVACVVRLDADWPAIANQSSQPLEPLARASDLAYVLYTSGSTGKPKGVQVEHRSVVSFLQSMHREPGVGPHDRFVSVTTLSFDIAGLEIHGPLTAGGTVVLASRALALDGVRLTQLLDTTEATILQGTPATWRLLLEAGWTGRKGLKMLCGGEALPRDLATRLLELGGELWNMYGPTETTIWSTISPVRDASRPIVVGRPIANTQVYVLESSGLPAPIGVAGELCIGGAGVARGYRNRDALNAEKFVPLTLGGVTGRVYRTGDLARFFPDGELEFIGRRDQQVKLRGFRIELGEIESVLATYPGVRKCVVIVREDQPGEQRLVAYVVPEPRFDAEGAREALRAKLPDYMVPRLFVPLESLPLTPNAKVDRRALPVPAVAPVAVADAAEAARSPTEKRVSAVWCAVLSLERVGLHDNFFDVGGNSLLLVRLQTSLKREFAVDVPLIELFQRTTVATQAQRFGAPAASDSALRRAQARAARQSSG